ncbi:phage tail protein [Lactobacillus hominis]|uniref:phage tail tube protein n=1 Tax=Lactobacillus hominis TaxID=1203033 RepID=UPI0023F2F645|nr:phage tail protein [Lactobacillus hominis]
MAQNKDLVSTFRPQTAGAISYAPLGTAVPTNAVDELDPKFTKLGYISEDGMTKSFDFDSDTEKAWGGDPVNNIFNGKTTTFEFKLIELLNKAVNQAVFGQNNVSGDFETGITVKDTNAEPESYAWVVDMIGKNGALTRIVIPSALITDMDDITYATSESAGYDITITPQADENGVTNTTYIQKPPTTAAKPSTGGKD